MLVPGGEESRLALALDADVTLVTDIPAGATAAWPEAHPRPPPDDLVVRLLHLLI